MTGSTDLLARGPPRRRIVALLALLVVPWTLILVAGGQVVAITPFAVVEVAPGLGPAVRVVPVTRFFGAGGGLPRNPQLWPASILLYLLSVASAASGAVFGREDVRVTAGALVLAGLAHLGVGYAFVHRIGWTPLPVGVVAVFGVAWWYYWPALRAVVLAPGRE